MTFLVGRLVRSTTIASVLQIPTTPTTPTTTTPIIPKKKSRNLNLNSRYGTNPRSALLVVASFRFKILKSDLSDAPGF